MPQNIFGLNELDTSIKTMLADLSGSGLIELTKAAADVIQPEIEQRAPQLTGHLQGAIESISTQQSGTRAETVIQVADSAPGGANHYAIYEEFGTCQAAAHPFVRPGFEASKAAAAKAAENKLNEIIRRKS